MKLDLRQPPKLVGIIIHKCNDVEQKMTEIICSYFQPAKEAKFFEKIFLNSMIIGMGSKIKILANLNEFDEKIIQKIRNLSNIRNAVAHNNPQGKIDVKLMESTIDVSYLHSSGKVRSEKLDVLFEKCNEYYKDIFSYLDEYHKTHG